MQVVNIEIPDPSFQFFCPLTGVGLVNLATKWSHSSATKFIFSYEAGEFDYVAEELADVAKAADEEAQAAYDRDDDNAPDSVVDLLLEKLKDNPNLKDLVVFNLDCADGGCGCSSTRIAVAIDFASCPDWEEEQAPKKPAKKAKKAAKAKKPRR